MGITGLIPLLREAHSHTHISDYAGRTLAVDAYVWLHRGAYGCAQELATGQPTLKYVNYALDKIRMLRHYKVTPYIVFDGSALPSKLGTELERGKRRSDALAKGNAFLAAGNLAQARDAFVKAVDVTPAMAYQLIKALKREGVEYVVAPYEADPQLAYLERIGVVDGIITEDSDLLVFGCKRILFKLERDGSCLEIQRDNLGLCREVSFTGWTDKEFRQMAILSGCDYLDSIHGIGIKKAHALIRKYKTAEKAIQAIRLDGQYTVPVDYPAEFKRAELTFCHQHVFNPTTQFILHLEPLPAGMTVVDLPFVGPPMELQYARGIASGAIDPLSKLPIVDVNPTSFSDAPTNSARPSFYKGATAKKTASPVKGAGSLLNWFKKDATPVASTSGARRAVMMVTSSSKLERTVIAVKQSKFFGGGAEVEGQAKGKQVSEVASVVSGGTEADMDDSGFFDGPLLDQLADDMSDVPRHESPHVPEPSSHAGHISSPVTSPPAQLPLSPTTPSRVDGKGKRRRVDAQSSFSCLSELPAEDVKPPMSEFDAISSPVEIVTWEGLSKRKVDRREKQSTSKSDDMDSIDLTSSSVCGEEGSPQKKQGGKKHKRAPEEGKEDRKPKRVKLASPRIEQDKGAGIVAANWRAKFAMGAPVVEPRKSISVQEKLAQTNKVVKKSSSATIRRAAPLPSTMTAPTLPRAPASPKKAVVMNLLPRSPPKPLSSHTRLSQFQFRG